MTSLQPDPYKILGVSKDAQLPEIRSAHRKLVLKCHPDKVQDPTLKAQKQDEFQKVQQAYELLSDENERAKYDDNVKLAELRSQMAKGMSANTSAPRAPRTFDVNIRTAEPRPDTFKTTSYRTANAAPKMYQYTSRSYEEDLHRPTSISQEPRGARRATSYEKSFRQEDDRERERRRKKDDERERERMAIEREKERIAIEREKERAEAKRQEAKAAEKRERKALEKAAEEKEARRRERKALEKAEKERDKERRHATEEKSRRHKTAYVEPYGEEETYTPKSDKKKSSSPKKYEEKEKDQPPPVAAAAPPVDAVNSKMTQNMYLAASYMDKSRKAGAPPPLGRAQTFNEGSIRYTTMPPIAAPTPPAATPFAPPPVPGTEEDVGRRSKSRRSSDSKRDKSSHKKSSPLKETPAVPPSPEVFTASPGSRHMPQQFTSSPAGGSPPKHTGLSRAATLNEYSRPPPGPARAQTFTYGRTRSRLQPQTVSEDSESDEDPRPRRSHRHKTHDEPIPLDYGRSTRYTVNTSGRAVPVAPDYYREESPPPRKPYYGEMRPPMPPRESSYSSSAFKVKTSNRYTTDDVQYSNIPHRYTQEYAY